MKNPISGDDYRRAAAVLGCEPEAIEAVAIVESSGSGFNPDETPRTLFEGHHFHRLTGGRFDASAPTLSYPKWTREHYGRNWKDEWDRLRAAMNLDADAAMMATSWGKFQIMGFNAPACGFVKVFDFVKVMGESEAKHLDAFVAYIQSRHLADELVDHRWADFARLYNGRRYAENQYDTKMAAAYAAAKRANA